MLLWATSSALAAERKRAELPETVRDLRYGVMLYQHLRGEYLDALVESAVADSEGGFQGHGDYPRLMRGNSRLNWRMDHAAYSDFAFVLKDGAHAEVADQAWFYLGKLYQHRLEYDKAQIALSRVHGKLDKTTTDELHYLRSIQALLDGDSSAAKREAKQLRRRSEWHPYFLFQAAQIALDEDDVDSALSHLFKILDQRAHDQEGLVVHDRARLQIGQLLIQEGREEQAVPILQSIRQQSPYADRALLALGWAAAEGNNPHAALAPWQALDSDPRPSLSQAEARLGLPWLYQKIGKPGLARKHFDQAANHYRDQIQDIDLTLSSVDLSWSDSNQPLAALLESWPQLPELTTLAASRAFRLSLGRYRDLKSLQQRLNADQARAQMLNYGLNLRQQRFRNQAETQKLDQYAEVLAHARNLRNKLSQQLADAEHSGEGQGLLASKELSQQKRIESAIQKSAQLKEAGINTDSSTLRLQRLKGILDWTASQQYHSARWSTKRQLDALNTAIASAEERHTTLKAHQLEQLPFAETASRLDRVSGDAEALLQKTEGLLVSTAEELQQQLRATLLARRNLLQRYRQFAQLSAARLSESAIEDVL